MRRRGLPLAAAVVLLSVTVGGAVASLPAGASAHRRSAPTGTPPVARPTPGLVPVVLDYTPPLTFHGTTVYAPPLEHAVVAAALEDFSFLKYLQRSDLGGFEPAPVGHFLTTTTGHAVTAAPKQAQIPLLTQVGKKVTIFGYRPGAAIPSTTAPVRPITVPPTRHTTPTTPITPPARTPKATPHTGFVTPPPPSVTTAHPTTTSPTTTPPTSTTAPPASTTTTKPPASTTTTTAPLGSTTTTTAPLGSTTTTTTTTPPPHKSTPPASTPPPTQYLELTETNGHYPVIDVTNMAPGQSAAEQLTLENLGTTPFDLSMKSVGTTTNTLSKQLRLVVTGTGVDSGHVYYDGSLSSTDTGVQITRLAPHTTIKLEVKLTLPTTAGNDVQHQTAKVNLYWVAN